MRREGFVQQVAWASRPCFWSKEMHGRDAHATSLPFLLPHFFSVASSVPSVSSVAPPGHQINQSRCSVKVAGASRPCFFGGGIPPSRNFKAMTWKFRAFTWKFQGVTRKFRAVAWKFQGIVWKFGAVAWKFQGIVWKFRVVAWKLQGIVWNFQVVTPKFKVIV